MFNLLKAVITLLALVALGLIWLKLDSLGLSPLFWGGLVILFGLWALFSAIDSARNRPRPPLKETPRVGDLGRR